ncbi:MAG: hypothetical protein WC091_20150 [Sulfuricellaceae bacterium]
MCNRVVLNSFVIYFASTRLVRTLRAGLHGFPGAWRRCNSSEWNTILRRCALPCTRKTAHSSPFNGGF